MTTEKENNKTLQAMALEFVQLRSDKSFSELYKRMKPGLVQYAMNMVLDDEAAEDIVSSAFLKMWMKIDQYDTYWNFSTWAYRIVFNECMQHIRKSKQVLPLFDNHDFSAGDIDAADPDWELAKSEDLHEIMYKTCLECIHGLPDGLYKNIMIDRELHSMKYHEISEKYGININSVKTRISRAREMVQRAVKIKMEKYEETIDSIARP